MVQVVPPDTMQKPQADPPWRTIRRPACLRWRSNLFHSFGRPVWFVALMVTGFVATWISVPLTFLSAIPGSVEDSDSSIEVSICD